MNKLEYNDPICGKCAEAKGWKSKGVCGMWIDNCSVCGVETCLCAVRDYKKPGQRPITLDDIYIYEANNPERK